MDKKFCDKCKREIRGFYYVVSAWKYNTEKDIESDDPEKEVEICPACYKKIEF